MTKSTRQIGKDFEEYICYCLREALNDETIRPTRNSGASTELEDILCRQFIGQAKVDNGTENINIHYKDWKKLINKIPINSIRVPLFFYRNKNQDNFVMLHLEDFCRLLKELE